ncbi:MAG TPA: cell division protein FtsQ/DivIB [Bryobacteraceae bacterium]|nr:cell division protein FtsQ/DivIB [Bryobacteraceae bacterium]
MAVSSRSQTSRAQAQNWGVLNDLRWGRFLLWLVAGVLLMVGSLFAWHRTEDFLIRDDRFRVAEADEFAGQSPNLILEGVHYASASQIRHLFAQDFGRSLYLVPLQERRGQLLEIDWVEDAAVSKVWPDTLKVMIRERQPVAFLRLPPSRHDSVARFALVDHDGYILHPRVAAQFTLPVIAGVAENESIDARRARVHRALGMLKEVGPLAAQISEVDVTDPNNLIVAEHVGNSVVNLIIGEDNFAERLQNFVANYKEINTKRPGATTLDLRVDGIITAVGDKHLGQ